MHSRRGGQRAPRRRARRRPRHRRFAPRRPPVSDALRCHSVVRGLRRAAHWRSRASRVSAVARPPDGSAPDRGGTGAGQHAAISPTRCSSATCTRPRPAGSCSATFAACSAGLTSRRRWRMSQAALGLDPEQAAASESARPRAVETWTSPHPQANGEHRALDLAAARSAGAVPARAAPGVRPSRRDDAGHPGHGAGARDAGGALDLETTLAPILRRCSASWPSRIARR